MTGQQMAADAAAPHRRMASAETQRLYAVDWAAFEAWCTEQRQTALPAEPATVAAFLATGAQSLSAGALPIMPTAAPQLELPDQDLAKAAYRLSRPRRRR